MARSKATSALAVEQHGIDTIPEEDRTYTPFKIFTIVFGSSLTYTVIIFGAFPVLFGLGWWSSVFSVVAGLLIGSAVLAPMSLFGPRTGTNNAVASGAHFGVAGRIIGSFLALFSALGFVALTVWTSGDALIATLDRVVDVSGSKLAQAVAYALMILLVMTIAIRGIHLMAKVQGLMIPVMSAVLVLGVVAFGPEFDVSYGGSGEYALGNFWATFVGSVMLVAGLVISLSPFVGDWARYINPQKHSSRRVAGVTFLSAFIGIGLPVLWGVFVAVALAGATGDFIPALIASSPSWYVPFLVLLAGVAGVAQGSLGLYGTGLDTSSLLPRLSRARATAVIGGIASILVYLGAFVWDALAVVNAFVVLLIVLTAPWIAIVSVGYLVRRGYYIPEDLQVFTRGQTGGHYWFVGGLNYRAVVAWAVGSTVGVMFAAAPPILNGPWAMVANGIDVSLFAAGGAAAIVYIAGLVLFPEPSHVFAPEGPRLVSARAGELMPVSRRSDLSAPGREVTER